MKKLIVGIFSFILLLTAQNAFASTVWNGASNDCKGISIVNATTNEGYAYPCWPSSSVSADAGDTLNVRIYYHNTGTATANNTRVTLSAPTGSASNTKSFSGNISSDQGSLSLGSVTANLSSSQTITFNSVKWYTNNTSETLTSLPGGQSGSEILSGGLNLGSIAPGWATQGSLVVSFHVSNTVVPQSVCTISNFNANPTSITTGGSSTLSWVTSDCTSLTIYPTLGNVNSTSSQSVSPSASTTYTLTAYGASGAAQTRTAVVSVNQPAQVCSINNFSANPTSITTGGSSTLSWVTSDCTSLTIYPTLGNVNSTSSQSVSPSASTTYTLTAYGASGAAQTRTAVVSVNQPAQVCSINNFSANPTSITSGDSAILNWSTSDCTNVTISNLSYSVPTTGSQSVWPTQTTTYTLTARNSTSATQTLTATVYVSNKQVCEDPSATNYKGTLPCTPPQLCRETSATNYNGALPCRYPIQSVCSITSFSASDTSISDGDSVTLRWDTDNCDHVKLSNFSGNVSLSGSKTVYPTDDTTYILTAYDSDGSHETDSVKVYVDNNNNNNSNCSVDSFTASNTYINSGNPVTLRWDTSDCSNISISNIGNVYSSGSQIVYPTNTTNYILTAYGSNSGTQTRSVLVTVNQYITPTTPVYNNPVTPIYNSCAVTTVATNVNQTGAQLNGIVTSSVGANTYFEYGPTVGLGYRTNSRYINGNTNFSEMVSTLSPNTIYYFRMNSDCQNGTSLGSIAVFRTLGIPQATTVGTITNVVTAKPIIIQGTTITGSASPIVLRIENRYQNIGIGDIIDYTVYYKNISNSTLTHPMVQVFIPQGITLINSSRGTYRESDKTLSVPIEDLVPNAEGVIYLQARVDTMDVNLAQIVTTAILVYTNPNGAQENAMAYVLNNPRLINTNLLGASAFFGNIFGLGLIGWLILIILILLLILIARSLYNQKRRNVMTTTTQKTISQ